MTAITPVEPKQRIEILDVLRGFALLGIIFNNMMYFSGYAFMPFENIKLLGNFELNESIYSFLDFIIKGKFYTLFSILFAVGFYLQFSKNKEDAASFLKIYRRRIFILFIIGLIHSLIWNGDILLTYSIIAFILILFRNVKKKNLFRLALFFILVPFLLDLILLPLEKIPRPIVVENSIPVAHVTFPDMSPESVISTFQNGSLSELFFLNIHNVIWKYLGYIPSGRFFILLGIFLLGYYLAATGFFTNQSKSKFLFISSLVIGVLSTVSAKILGGNPYQFPSTLLNTLYKFLIISGQIFMCVFYITSIFKIFKTTIGEKVLKHLIPVGRMALTNYLSQTIIMITIFYNFGFNLIGRVGLPIITGIVIIILILQIVCSNIWLKYYRFGPFEWLWRSLTYRKKIRNKLGKT